MRSTRTTFHHPERSSHPFAGERPQSPHLFEAISAAVRRAMEITLERGLGCAVERVTTHEPVPGGFFGMQTVSETVTGRVSIPGPRSYEGDPRLSRYHPVNGWAVPETIDIDVEG